MIKIVQIITLQKFQFVIILVNPINVWTSLNTVLIEVFSQTLILIVHLADFLTCNQTSLFITLWWIYITLIIILIFFQQIKIIFVYVNKNYWLQTKWQLCYAQCWFCPHKLIVLKVCDSSSIYLLYLMFGGSVSLRFMML